MPPGTRRQEKPTEPTPSGYVDLKNVFSAILDDPSTETSQIRRVTIDTFANGDVTYRCYKHGDDEPQVGFLPEIGSS